MDEKFYNELQTRMDKIPEKKASGDLLEQFRTDQAVADRMMSKDIYDDALRSPAAIPQNDSMDSMMRASSFLKKQLAKLNIPVLGYKYEQMDVEKWADGANLVKEGEARFVVDVIDKEGAQRSFTVPIKFAEAEMVEPKFFIDTLGRKYAFTNDGIDMYLTDDDQDDIEDKISFNETNDVAGRQAGEEEALAGLRFVVKLATTEQAGMDNLDEAIEDENPGQVVQWLKGMLSYESGVGTGAMTSAPREIASAFEQHFKSPEITNRLAQDIPDEAERSEFVNAIQQAIDEVKLESGRRVKKVRELSQQREPSFWEKVKDVGQQLGEEMMKASLNGMTRTADLNSFKNFSEKYLIESGVEMDEGTKQVLDNDNTNYEETKTILTDLLGNDESKFVQLLEGFVAWATISSVSRMVRTASSIEEASHDAIRLSLDLDGHFVEQSKLGTYASLISNKFACSREDALEQLQIAVACAEDFPTRIAQDAYERKYDEDYPDAKIGMYIKALCTQCMNFGPFEKTGEDDEYECWKCGHKAPAHEFLDEGKYDDDEIERGRRDREASVNTRILQKYAEKAVELVKWAAEDQEENKVEDLDINFEGDLVITDKGGEEILRFQATELAMDDLDALKKEDVERLTNLVRKLKDMGIEIATKPDMDLGEFEGDILNDEEVMTEFPTEDAPLEDEMALDAEPLPEEGAEGEDMPAPEGEEDPLALEEEGTPAPEGEEEEDPYALNEEEGTASPLPKPKAANHIKGMKVFATRGMRYGGFQVEAGSMGKVMNVYPDLIGILWDKDQRQLARLVPPRNVLSASEMSWDEFRKKAAFNLMKKGQSVTSLAKQFMTEDDYDTFKKLIALKNLYTEENQTRQSQGMKSTRTKITDINDKMDTILEQYKESIMDEFEKQTKASQVNRLVKLAKGVPWVQKDRGALKSRSMDNSQGKLEDEMISPAKQGETTVDIGQDPLSADNTPPNTSV